MMRAHLAIAITLLLVSCDKDTSNNDTESATAGDDYSLAVSDIPETLDSGTLSNLKITLKRGGETVGEGALATARIALAISCSAEEDKDNKISIDKVVEATDGEVDFGDIKVSEKACKAGKYNCSLSLSSDVDDKKIEKTADFVFNVEAVGEQCAEDSDAPKVQVIDAGQLFDIEGNAGDSVSLRKNAAGHCKALLLQEVMTNDELTIKEQEIVVARDDNARRLFIVGNVANCELYVGQTKVDNKQFTSTVENPGSQIPVKRDKHTQIEVDQGGDPNGGDASDNPTVQELFISQGLTYTGERLPANPSWSKRWQKSGATELEYNSTPQNSGVAWQAPYTNAMAIIKADNKWTSIGLIVPTDSLQIKGTMTAGREFTVEGRDGGILSLADQGGTCAASLYRHEKGPGNGARDFFFHGNSIRMSGNGEAGGLLIAGNPSNCQLMVGVEKVAGSLVAMPVKEGAEVVAKINTQKQVEVIFGPAPMSGGTISELFIQLGTADAWGNVRDGRRDGTNEKTFNWDSPDKQATYVNWGSSTRARAFIKTSNNEWYSINY